MNNDTQDPAETLSQAIKALTEEKSIAHRRHHANIAYLALRALQERLPPANLGEAQVRSYQQGLLHAIPLINAVREEHERPLRAADVGRAYTVLNGVINYGQFLCSEAVSRISQAAIDAEFKKTPRADADTDPTS